MKPVSITFLGTCSGGGPLISRACTATALNFESTSWLVDCAESTQTQILRTHKLRIGRFDRIFVTHMHSDHVMGIIPFIRSVMYNAESPSSYNQLRMQLYGPPGLRSFVRFNLNMTQASIIGRYAVHELLQPGEEASVGCEPGLLHENEAPGMDIIAGQDGLWRDIAGYAEWSVDAGPLTHRTRSVGYVFREAPSTSFDSSVYIPALDRNSAILQTQGIKHPRSLMKKILKDRQPVHLPDGTILEPPPLDVPGRKIVILGDTSDSTQMIPIAMDASVLVHESTNAYMPKEIVEKVRGMTSSRGSMESVRVKAIGRGHSTADMAGEFAKAIRARRLFLNHFSTKLSPGGQSPPSPDQKVSKSKGSPTRVRHEAALVMNEIERQASEAWGMGKAVATVDLLTVEIPQHEVLPESRATQGA